MAGREGGRDGGTVQDSREGEERAAGTDLEESRARGGHGFDVGERITAGFALMQDGVGQQRLQPRARGVHGALPLLTP